MKILVTGSNGQLGRSLRREFDLTSNHEVIYTDIDSLDLCDKSKVEEFIKTNDFDIIINCAAYTAVDKAETDNLKAEIINSGAVGNIASAVDKTGKTKIIHISTDYVFSGESFRPYIENDEPQPRSIYGRTKLEGEGILFSLCPDSIILRTAWLYSEFGSNFAKTMLRLAKEDQPIRVVADQIGTPTYAGDLAKAIINIIESENWVPGIYHFTNEGVASWYDFAMEIFRLSGIKVREVTPVTTSEYKSVAMRPMYSVLDKSKIKNMYNIKIPYWVDSLQKCLKMIEIS